MVHVDASRIGLGAVLYQRAESGLQVLAYASKSMSSSEKNYSAHKMEFLGLKWAVTVKFHYYLYGKPFTVYTDHNPLAYVTTSAKLDATGHRWLAELSNYDFKIFYKPGKLNGDADGLSRRPCPEKEELDCTSFISKEVFKEVCSAVTSDEEFTGVAECLAVSATALVDAITVGSTKTLDWEKEQKEDADIARAIVLVSAGVKPTERERRKESPGLLRLLSLWSNLVVKNGILFKEKQSDGEQDRRIIVPTNKQMEVLKMSHDDMGHLGRDKTLSIASDRFYWVGLTKDIEDYIKRCPRCLRAKAPHLPHRAPLCSITTTRPLELVCMDFMSLETSKGGYKHILVVTDHFTKYTCAFPTRSQHASVVAKILMEQFVVHYGIPERLHSDQGANFEGNVIRGLCKLLGMKKSRTTPYHPQGDGITERFNRTLLSMLSTLDLSQKINWKEHVAPLVHAYNSTRHDTTGYTPFFLMFGRSPRLPVDVFLGLSKDFNSCISGVQKRLETAYRTVTKVVKVAAKRQEKGYNQKVRGQRIQKGDFVLVRNVGFKGKHKLADRWQQERYVVVDQPNKDIPVFRVSTENGKVTKVLHRNMLLPLCLPLEDVDETIENQDEQSSVSSYSDSESEENFEVDISLPADVHRVQEQPQAVDIAMDNEDVNLSIDESIAEVEEEAGINLREEETSEKTQIENQLVEDIGSEVSEVEENQTEEQLREGNEVIESDPVVPEVEIRRSSRIKKPPDYLKDYVSHSQTVVLGNWRDRVSVLIEILGLFPCQNVEICNAILYVITHSG